MSSALSCFTLISEYLEDRIISWEVFMIIKDFQIEFIFKRKVNLMYIRFMINFKALIRHVVDKSLLNIKNRLYLNAQTLTWNSLFLYYLYCYHWLFFSFFKNLSWEKFFKKSSRKFLTWKWIQQEVQEYAVPQMATRGLLHTHLC